MLTLATGISLSLSIGLDTLWTNLAHLRPPATFLADLATAGSIWLIMAGAGWGVVRQIDRLLTRDWLDIVSWINQLDDRQWQPLPIPDTGPWGQLSYALNQMARRLSDSQSQRDLFLASVAHELKTPLAVLRGNLEGLATGELPATPERWTALHREVHRLTRLVNDLLLIETLRSPTTSIHLTRYSISEQVQETLLKFAPLAAIRQIALKNTVEPVDIEADRERMDQVLTNLMDNAMRHTPIGGHIEVTLRVLNDRMVCCVNDSGSGIPPTQKPWVTQPFYRDPRSPGSGLGLAVALTLLTAQGGTLVIGRSPLGGAQVCFTLPRISN